MCTTTNNVREDGPANLLQNESETMEDVKLDLLLSSCCDLQQQKQQRKSSGGRSSAKSVVSCGELEVREQQQQRRKKMKKPSRRAVTTDALPATDSLADQMMLKKRIRRAITHNNYNQKDNMNKENNSTTTKSPQQAPDVCLLLILGGATRKISPDAFVGVTKNRIKANSLEITQAIRGDDLAILEQVYEQGGRLDGCSSQGESTVHLAARLGRLNILRFLVEKANVPLLVKDDTGRTPLHDACWSDPPQFDLVHFLVDKAPELLFVLDQRGYTAFQYIPQACWNSWCDFLRENASFLQNKVDYSGHLEALNEAQKRMQALLRKASQFQQEMGPNVQGATTA